MFFEQPQHVRLWNMNTGFTDELIALYREYADFQQPSPCDSHLEFSTWNCCDMHRNADTQLQALRAKAADLATRSGTDLTWCCDDGIDSDMALSPMCPLGLVRMAQTTGTKLPRGLSGQTKWAEHCMFDQHPDAFEINYHHPR